MYNFLLPTILGLSLTGGSGVQSPVNLITQPTVMQAPDTNLIAQERTTLLDMEQEEELLKEKNEAIKNSYYLGRFELTAYCNCSICCGQWAGGPCFNGEYPTDGWTIAVDKNVIPINSEVLIDCDYFGGEHLFKAQDTGSAIIGNRIDIYMDSHSECLQFGRRYADVYYDYREHTITTIEELQPSERLEILDIVKNKQSNKKDNI